MMKLVRLLVQTWTCGTCGTANPPTTAQCRNCGKW